MKRNNRSLSDKIKIIDAVEKAGPHAKKSKIAADFNIPESTLSNILKNKEALRSRFNSGISCLTSQRSRTCNAEEVDKLLFNWFTGARTANISITGEILREKAQRIADEIGLIDWQCSSSWISRWKIRYNISLKVTSGESSAVDMDVVNDYVTVVLPRLQEGYEPRNVFNADETGLFWRATPTITLELKGKKCYGGKLSKERITVLVAANADGSEKLPLFSIGRFNSPRCFKNIKQKPIEYESNRKAWMTADIFSSWVKRFDLKMVRQKRKVLLFIDNCCAHPKIHGLRAVTLHFLPPNTTSVIQPCDAGIIKNLKHYYRKILMSRMLDWYDSGKDMKEFHITLLDAMIMLKGAWNDKVSTETIRNCFNHCGFFKSTTDVQSQTNDGLIDSEASGYCQRLQQLQVEDSNLNVGDLVSVDEDLATSHFTDEMIIEVDSDNGEESEIVEDDCGDPLPLVTKEQVSSAVQLLKLFVMQHDLDDTAIRSLERVVSQHHARAAEQSTLDSYFNRA